jgi:hypothetical protein
MRPKEKKRCHAILFLVALLTIVPFALSKTEEFSGEILSGESIEIDDFTFIITMNKYANAIFVDGGKIFQTVPLYSCKDMSWFEICFDNTTYNDEENDLYAIVRVFRYKPDLSLTREMNTTELYAGQEAEVTITVNNNGDTASQVILTDDYPTGILIYDLEGGCSVHENEVYWQGHLDGNKSRECRFLIKGTKEAHQSLAAHLKYWDGFKWVDEYSSTLKLDIEPVLLVSTAVVREDYEADEQTFDFDEENPFINVGETLRLIINLTNNFPGENMDVNYFEINLPPELVYSGTGYLRFNYLNSAGNRTSHTWNSEKITKISNTKLSWKGTISNKSKAIIIKLKAVQSGKKNAVMAADYSYNGLHFRDSIQESFDVRNPGIAQHLTILDKSKRFSAPERLTEEEDAMDLESLHPYSFTVYIQNANKYAELKDIEARIITDLAGFKTVKYPAIEKEGTRIPYSTEIIPPWNETSIPYKVNISIRFKNEYGETGENSTEYTLTVIPAKDIDITWDSSEGEVLFGAEETEVTVSVRNDRLIDLKEVTVKDTIDPSLHIEGVHAKTVKLNREEDTEVYTYRIRAPVVHNKTYYNITTTVSFFDPDRLLDLNFTETRQVTVEPLEPDLEFEMTYEKPETIYPGALIPVEYRLSNPEENEIIRSITINFPVQEDIDHVGPATFFIDGLEPGESFTIKNLVRMRPKEAGDSRMQNMTLFEFYDNYGNRFQKNSTPESFDVEPATISGPSIYLRTRAPAIINKSTDATIKIDVINNGTADTTASVKQGERTWNVSVAARSTTTIRYTTRYDETGNYTIPDPHATFDLQGFEAHTKGTGTNTTVLLLQGPAETETEEEVTEAITEEIPEDIPEKEEMSFEEYDKLENERIIKKIIRYSILSGVFLLTLTLIMLYIGYQRRKPPEVPIMKAGEEE